MDEISACWLRTLEAPTATEREEVLEEFLRYPHEESRAVVRRHLLRVSHRRSTLHVLAAPRAQRLAQGLLPELMELASTAHQDIQLVRRVIAGLPRGFVAEAAWPTAEEILARGGWEEPRRLGELFIELGLREPLERLIAFAEGHQNVDIAEVAEDLRGVWGGPRWGRPIGSA